MPKRSGRLWGAALLVVLCALVSACGSTPTVKAKYHPPILPIEISVDTEGHVSVEAGAEWVTPIGTFGLSAEVRTPSDDTTLLAIQHRSAQGAAVQDRFSIASGDRLAVCFNGAAYGEFGEHRILLNALDSDSSIRIVSAGSGCPARQTVQPRTTGTTGDYRTVRVSVGGTALTVLLADTDEKIKDGLSGYTAAQLQDAGVDGMLYVMSRPETYDPGTGNGAFIFPGYRFSPEVHFFDATGRYWAGGPVQPCAADRSDCRPYFATLYDVPVPYQYVLELIRGTLPSVPPGTPLLSS